MVISLAERLAELETLSTPGLRARWESACGQPAPRRMSRNLLLRALAYRVQEAAEGGLSKAALRRLASLIESNAANAKMPASDPLRLKPGSRLVREWQGEVHHVAVLEQGFDYRGMQYTSLSQVARIITGVRWSGPRFFGLRKLRRSSKETSDGA